ncbi:MAG: MotA/TolQ/ExbB proton channel family protein [Planctomycetes bacterium]|nr:MotA/TolQ/ExbB proton channel family protein [Planctomycetota bacterium]
MFHVRATIAGEKLHPEVTERFSGRLARSDSSGMMLIMVPELTGAVTDIVAEVSKGGVTLIPLLVVAFLIVYLCALRYVAIRRHAKGLRRSLEAGRKGAHTDAHALRTLKVDAQSFDSTPRTLVAIAPLLGLLGTVIGMMETFDVIAISGTSDANAMSGGISEALLSTQVGLMIAVPGMFAVSVIARAKADLTKLIEAALSEHPGRL